MIKLLFLSCSLILRTGALLAEIQSVTIQEIRHDVFHIDGRFTVHASTCQTWKVLTDYNCINNFVSSMESSKLKEKHDGYSLVEQVSRQGILIFRQRFKVLLRVFEIQNEKIEFEDILKEDFKSYRGFWKIGLSPLKNTTVSYYLDVEYSGSSPSFLTRRLLRKNIINILTGVAEEIEKNSSLNCTHFSISEKLSHG